MQHKLVAKLTSREDKEECVQVNFGFGYIKEHVWFLRFIDMLLLH